MVALRPDHPQRTFLRHARRAFIDPAAAEKPNRENQFGNYRVVQQLRAGQLWPRGELPADYGEPVKSDVPVLIFCGLVLLC